MPAFIRRFLLIACGIVVVPPPAWCQFVTFPQVHGKAETPKKAHDGCCDSCGCKDREKPPREPKHPVPACRCCCYELDWLKPNPPEKPVVDLSLLAFLTPHSGSEFATLRHDLGLSLRGPSPPLHLLKCVWLC
jgi:hypothetical protein